MSPSLKVTLIDANRKKVSFLRHAIRILDLKNARAKHVRLEELADDPIYLENFDVVISRAYASLQYLIENALSLLARDGVLIILTGKRGKKEFQTYTDGDPISTNLLVKTKHGKKLFLDMKIRTYSLAQLGLSRSLIMLRIDQKGMRMS